MTTYNLNIAQNQRHHLLSQQVWVHFQLKSNFLQPWFFSCQNSWDNAGLCHLVHCMWTTPIKGKKKKYTCSQPLEITKLFSVSFITGYLFETKQSPLKAAFLSSVNFQLPCGFCCTTVLITLYKITQEWQHCVHKVYKTWTNQPPHHLSSGLHSKEMSPQPHGWKQTSKGWINWQRLQECHASTKNL